MWPLALAIVADLSVVVGSRVNLARSLPRVPLLGPLYGLGGVWRWGTESATVALFFLGALGLVSIGYRVAIIMLGEAAVARFLRQAGEARPMRSLVRLCWATTAAGIAVTGATRPGAVALLAEVVVLIALAWLLAPLPLLRPTTFPFQNLFSGVVSSGASAGIVGPVEVLPGNQAGQPPDGPQSTPPDPTALLGGDWMVLIGPTSSPDATPLPAVPATTAPPDGDGPSPTGAELDQDALWAEVP